MSKLSPVSLLEQSLSEAQMKKGTVDFQSIKQEYLLQIVKNKSYDQGVDYQILWDTVFIGCLKIHDFDKKEGRPLTSAEKTSVVKYIHNLLSNIPYEYTFYYRLPDNYPGEYKEYTPNFAIKIISQKLHDELAPAISESGLAKALLESELKERTPEVNKPYIVIKDKGYIRNGTLAFLESRYTPDRLVGLYYSLQILWGSINTAHYARHYYTPRVFGPTNNYISNYPNPLRSSRAETIVFDSTSDEVNALNELFIKLTTVQSNKNEENARIQICNALYWYMEFLNAGEISLQAVFLVSAIDSLFPSRNHTITGRMIFLSSDDKASIAAEVVAGNEKEKANSIEALEKLFNKRNLTIHGQVEIHGFSKSKQKETSENRQLVGESEQIFQKYMKTRLKRFLG